MRGGLWLLSLVVATGAFQLYTGCGSADRSASSSAATACPHIELQPSSACVPWPTVAMSTVATTDGGVTCTWSDVTEPGIDEAIGPGGHSAMWATASDQVYVSVSSLTSAATLGFAHLDGTRWTREPLPLAGTVFSLWSPTHPATEIDLFVEEPFPFDAALARAVRADLGSTSALVASIDDLIVLKRRAGRAKDEEDIRALEALRDGGEDG